jgi:hypothetical protein
VGVSSKREIEVLEVGGGEFSIFGKGEMDEWIVCDLV